MKKSVLSMIVLSLGFAAASGFASTVNMYCPQSVSVTVTSIGKYWNTKVGPGYVYYFGYQGYVDHNPGPADLPIYSSYSLPTNYNYGVPTYATPSGDGTPNPINIQGQTLSGNFYGVMAGTGYQTVDCTYMESNGQVFDLYVPNYPGQNVILCGPLWKGGSGSAKDCPIPMS